MSKTYRVGVIGFAHMHINNVLGLFAKHPQVELVACADTVPARPELRKGPYTRQWNLEHARKDLGMPRSYECYREMLDAEGFDIVICTSENAKHPEVVAACAAAGVHVCVEKPMAASLSDALAMVRAVRAAGTKMLINWPMTWNPAAHKAKALIDAGTIGRVLEVKARLGHTGPLGSGARHEGVAEEAAPLSANELGAVWWHSIAAGGGAMLDFCCYGCMIARWFVGAPAVAAIGMRGNLNSPFGDADDNGAMIVRFPAAMGLFEGTWTTHHHGVGGGPIVYGTGGTLVMESRDGEAIVRQEHAGGKTTLHQADPLPADRCDIAHEYVHHLETGEAVHPTLDMMLNLDAMAILDAGVRSAESGEIEAVNSQTWCVG
ncbi:MAG TPA: Gfo/Idh/MocA family oxidoreductase [Phycisphaerae bacterium]|nr:Gfo/Idh/MocA family oxidoreductase [Phycisphaerae bacterium]